MRAILVKIYLLLIQQTPENIPLQENNAPNHVKILQSQDKKKIKQLINDETAENPQLKKTLRFINLNLVMNRGVPIEKLMICSSIDVTPNFPI